MYRKAASLSPPPDDYVGIHLGIARVLEHAGRVEEALGELEHALTVASTDELAVPAAYPIFTTYARLARTSEDEPALKWLPLFRSACARRGIQFPDRPIQDPEMFRKLILETL